jgi:NTE family protein
MVYHIGALWRLNEAGLLKRLSRVSSVSGGSITAGVLGMLWKSLEFDGSGICQNLNTVFDKLREFAGRTVDEGSVLGGIFLPGTIGERVAASYDKYLFNGRTLQDLPSDNEGPRFVLNATNVQTGSLWRFSKPFMGDWQVGLIKNPRTPLAQAVSASSAFPPVLSPVRLDVSPNDFDPATYGPLFADPYNDEVVLADGGVYDNMGLETAIKSYQTVLVSDAGMKMGPEPHPESDWARHSIRVMSLLDNQVRALRKRQLIDLFDKKVRSGAYWGIGLPFNNYLAGQALSDPLGLGAFDPSDLAGVKTRLKAMPDEVQVRLINWGYASADTALRRWAAADLKQRYGVTIADPRGKPYSRPW